MYGAKKLAIVVLISIWGLSGCGGGGSSTATTSTTTGFLVDAPIEGARYTCGNIEGYTTSTGAFECVVTPVTFYIGQLKIGKIDHFTDDGIVYPQDLVGKDRTDFNSSEVVQIARLLQSLDDDGNISTTIKITRETSNLFDSNVSDVNISDASIGDLAVIAGVTLVSEEEAIAHLREQLRDKVPPVVTASANITILVESESGVDASDSRIVAFLNGASATDNVGVVGEVTNNAPSIFPVGTTTVTFTAVDAEQNEGTATATVTVNMAKPVDTTNPVVTVPEDINISGTSASGIDASASQIVSFLASALASDDVDGTVSIANDAPSIFPVGTTTVIFTAQDTAGNTGTMSADVTVYFQETPQVYTLTGSITNADALSGQWTLNEGNVFVNDGGLQTSANVSFGSIKNGTSYTLTTSNGSCNVMNGTGTINGENVTNLEIICRSSSADTTNPVITVPANITVEGTSASGIEVTASEIVAFLAAATATDNVAVVGGVTNDAPTFFDIGTTTVTFTASDAAGNNAELTATVTVTEPSVVAPLTGFSPEEATYPSVSLQTGTDVRDKIASLYSEAKSSFKSGFNVINRMDETKKISIDYQSGTYSVTLVNGAEVQADNSVEIVRMSIRFDLGEDTEAFTEDDRIISYQINKGYSYARFSNYGTDATWFTDDDLLQISDKLSNLSHNPLTYTNSAGYQLVISDRIGGGVDRELFTADDEPSAYAVVALDANGYEGAVTVFNGAGNDGFWYTADDDIREHSVSQIDSHGNAFSSITFDGKGADAMWYTADDKVSFYTSAVLNDANKIEYLGTFADGDDNTWFTEDDTLSTQVFFAYDANGYQKLAAFYTSIGADDTWFTVDDTASAVSYAHSVSGSKTEETIHRSIGDDEKWVTRDDDIQNRLLYDENGALIYYYSGAGVDGLWYTDDDIGASYVTNREYDSENNLIAVTVEGGYYQNYKYDSRGYRIGTVYVKLENFGDDAKLRTADDTATSGAFYEYSDAGLLLTQSKLDSIGADGVWFTSDDTYSEYVVYTFNDQNVTTKRVTYGDSGSDSNWETAEDNEIINIQATSTDSQGRAVELVYYTDAGVDGIWETADDEIFNIQAYKYNDANNSYKYISYSAAGDDGLWRTDDDVSYSATGYILTDDGDVESIIYYNGAGEDTIWLTSDDVIRAHSEVIRDANGANVGNIYYSAIGDDDIWFTADDQSNGYTVFEYDSEGAQVNSTFYIDAGEDTLWLTADDSKYTGWIFTGFSEGFFDAVSQKAGSGRTTHAEEESATIPASIVGSYTLTYHETRAGSKIDDGTQTVFEVATDGTLTIDGNVVLSNPVLYRENGHEAIWFDDDSGLGYSLSSLLTGFNEINIGTNTHYDQTGFIFYGQYRNDVN